VAIGIFTSMANDELSRTIASLQAEIAVLREENARLRVARRTGVTDSLSVLRSLALDGPEAAGAAGADDARQDTGAASWSDEADAAWQTLTDALVMRDVLLDTCRQIQTLTAQLQRRLERLGPRAPRTESPAP
jgi:hypothetical protein